MSKKTSPPGDDFPGIDPTHSPSMRALIIKAGAARAARRQFQKAHEEANSELAALVELPEVTADHAAKAAGQVLITAPVDQRREPFAAFTDALVALAKHYPPGNPTRARVFDLVKHVPQLVDKALHARQQEEAALELLNTLAREIEAQHALERQQGGGIH